MHQRGAVVGCGNSSQLQAKPWPDTQVLLQGNKLELSGVTYRCVS